MYTCGMCNGVHIKRDRSKKCYKSIAIGCDLSLEYSLVFVHMFLENYLNIWSSYVKLKYFIYNIPSGVFTTYLFFFGGGGV